MNNDWRSIGDALTYVKSLRDGETFAVDSPAFDLLPDLRGELIDSIESSLEALGYLSSANALVDDLLRTWTIRFQHGGGSGIDVSSIIVWESGVPDPPVGKARSGRDKREHVYWDVTVSAINREEAIRMARKHIIDLDIREWL